MPALGSAKDMTSVVAKTLSLREMAASKRRDEISLQDMQSEL